jgi:hypothetical protein
MSYSNGVRGFLVECYWPGVSEKQIGARAARVRAATLERRTQRGRVDFVQSIAIPDDETVFWLFEGREVDVRAVAGEAGLTFERILESLTIDGSSIQRKEQK